MILNIFSMQVGETGKAVGIDHIHQYLKLTGSGKLGAAAPTWIAS
jgi:hypothetical protein